MVICIGPICIPVSMLWPFLLFLIKPLRSFFESYFAKPSSAVSSTEPGKEVADSKDIPPKEVSLSEVSGTDSATGLIPLEDEDEWPNLISRNTPTFALFSASWCGPCKKLKPFVEELAQHHRIEYIYVDDLQEIAVEAGVVALPTFQVWREGKLQGQVRGNQPTEVRALVEKHAKNST